MIDSIDHFVLTVRSLSATLAFYERVLGLERLVVPGKPASLTFGSQKINIHEAARPFEPKALTPTPGSADFCLITRWAPEVVMARLAACDVKVELGPVARTGALGPMISIYFRDPDLNLIEVSRYDDQAQLPA